MDNNAKDGKPDAKSQPTIDDIRKENTLEYYNDDMPRRAVGKLFYEDEDESARISVVKGYHEEQEPDMDLPEIEPRDPVMDFDIKDIRKSKSTMLDYDMSLYRSKATPEEELDFPVKTRKTEPEFFGQTSMAEPRVPKKETTFALNTTSQIRIGVSIAFLVLLLLLMVMIIQVNAANAKVKDMEAKAAEAQAITTEYNELKITNDKQKKEIDQLTQELTEARSVTTQPNVSTSTAPEESTDSVETTESGDTFYTVQKGDNLSKISKKFYGDSNQFQKIKDANSLTSDSIAEGQTLQIPK